MKSALERQDRSSNLSLHLLIAVAMGVVFVADLLTPLGVAVWVFYLAPVGLTILGWQPMLPLVVALAASVTIAIASLTGDAGPAPLWMAELNRAFGFVTLWTVALIARQLVATRRSVAQESWIQQAQTRLLGRLQGDLTEEQIGTGLLEQLALDFGVKVGAFYVSEGSSLSRSAGYAFPSEASIPERMKLGEGLVGQAAQEGRPLELTSMPEDALRISSALTELRATHVLVVPLSVDNQVAAVVELAKLEEFDTPEHALLQRVSEAVAVAVRSAAYRRRLQELLEETQHQADELQTQQEELRVANEELSSQSRILLESQARLEAQQAELEQTNAQLEEQARAIERQRDQLLRAQSELLAHSEEIAQASQYKSEFLANMSHELRTPLNSALILAKLLADNREGNLTPEQMKFAETIYSAGNDLLTLINDILDLSRIEAGRMDINRDEVEMASILRTLERTFQPVAHDKQVAFELVADPKLPPHLHTDPLRLQQILRNLLSNAFKFTEKGTVRLRAFRHGVDRIGFAVEDTGEGIPADKQEIIFEAFRQADGTTQRRHGGTGLGLTISRRLAERLGGDITVQSAPGKGSTFTVILPLHKLEEQEAVSPLPRLPLRAAPTKAPALAAPAAVQQFQAPPVPREKEPTSAPQAFPTATVADDRDAIASGDKSVLVVEDDLRFAEIARDMAREHDFRCLVATTASEGLALAEQYLPSAVILDMHLPDGSGLWVLERLKANAKTRHIPIHVVSVEDYTQQALALGAVGYALKPARREHLVQALDRLERKLEQKLRRVLVVEDNTTQRESLVALLRADNIEIVSVGTADEALELLKASTFDCMVLDLNLAGTSGFELLETMAAGETFSFPPVIVYTGRALTRDEEQRLRRYASSIIIKGARSPERLLDEVTLFLHKVESELPPNAQRMLRGARNREAVLDGRTILVAEDDVRNVFALSSVLEPKGAKLRIARNGREALDALTRAANDPQTGIDLVLMDIMMPEMDGLSAIREIRKQPEWKALPIIALTAKAMPDDRERCLTAGANDYIAKPLDVSKLISLIKVWMPK